MDFSLLQGWTNTKKGGGQIAGQQIRWTITLILQHKKANVHHVC
jgi:hypothetical protein